MNRLVNPEAFSVWDERLERQFTAHLAAIAKPKDPKQAQATHVDRWRDGTRKLRECTPLPPLTGRAGQEVA